MLSFIPAAFLLTVVEANVTLDYAESSGCPGDLVSFVCLATNTSIIRWLLRNNGDGLEFASIVDRNQNQLTIDENNIRTVIIAYLTNKTCPDGPLNPCSMESLIVIPIRPDILNFTLTCQSTHEVKTIFITTNGKYIARVSQHKLHVE